MIWKRMGFIKLLKKPDCCKGQCGVKFMRMERLLHIVRVMNHKYIDAERRYFYERNCN